MAMQPALPIRSRTKFPQIDQIRHLLVTASNPPSSTSATGLGYERCTALHNAIVKHGWQASGRALADLPMTAWWDAPQNSEHLEGLEQILHPSVVWCF
jgi:hypothetical protein